MEEFLLKIYHTKGLDLTPSPNPGLSAIGLLLTAKVFLVGNFQLITLFEFTKDNTFTLKNIIEELENFGYIEEVKQKK